MRRVITDLRVQAIAIALIFSAIAAATISTGIPEAEWARVRALGITDSAWTIPPILPSSDQFSYVNLAVSLSKGHGFCYGYHDPDFRAPFEALAAKGYDGYVSFIPRHSANPTAYRMPMYPYILSLCFRATGYNFYVPRILNCLLLGATAALIFLSASLLFSRAISLIAVLFFMINLRVWDYTWLLLTELPALFFSAAALYLLMLSIKKQRLLYVALTAAVLVCGIYTRAALLFFVPFFALAYLFAECWTLKKKVFAACSFCAVCGLLISPWVIRNNTVGGCPVGISTQGGINLPAGYTNICLRRKGGWDRPGNQPYAKEIIQAKNTGDEWGASQKGIEIFFRIVRENPGIVPRVALAKLSKMLLPNPHEGSLEKADFILLLLSLIGVFASNRQDAFALIAPVAGVVLCCTAIFANLRFSIPMAPALALLSASAVKWMMSKILTGKHVNLDTMANE